MIGRIGFSLCLLMIMAASALGQLSGRDSTPSGHIGAVMTVLATLEDAQVLPPEGTPEANRVIKIVIQFQSAFMKSADPAIRDFFQRALVGTLGKPRAGEISAAFHVTGWTSAALDALERYQATATSVELENLAAGFSQFNVTVADFEYLGELFRKARAEYGERGQDIHQIFAERRQGMPGGRS
jgi:hypothetical protein